MQRTIKVLQNHFSVNGNSDFEHPKDQQLQILYGHGALKHTAIWKFGKIAEISAGNPLPVNIFVTGTSGKSHFTGNTVLPVTY